MMRLFRLAYILVFTFSGLAKHRNHCAACLCALAALGTVNHTTASAQVISSANLVPIATRVLVSGAQGHNATDYAVQLGDSTTGGVQLIRAGSLPNGGNAGYQVVLLDRLDLHVVLNASYPVVDADSSFTFTSLINYGLRQNPGCQTNGCVMVMQSLGKMGYSPCVGVNITTFDCGFAEDAMEGIGASSPLWAANGELDEAPAGGPVAYSYIGTVVQFGVPEGAFYDRLTCRLPSNCVAGSLSGYSLRNTAPANAGADQIGNISGVLVKNATGHFAFTPDTPRMNFASVAVEGSGVGKNLITVGDAQLESASLPAGSKGGFHLVVVEATPSSGSLHVLLNQTYVIQYTNPGELPEFVANLEQLPQDIQRFQSRNRLFFLATMGSLDHSGVYGTTGYRYADIWDGVAQAVLSLGGDFRTFEQLNLVPPGATSPAHEDDYFLVGRKSQSGSPAHSVVEASTFISRQTMAKPPAVSNVAGFLKVDHEGYYEPAEFSGYGGFAPAVAISLANAAVQHNEAFPFTRANSTPGHRAAYAWFCRQSLVKDIRAQYTNADTKISNIISYVQAATWDPANYASTNPQVGFTQNDFVTVQSELKTELNNVSGVQQFQQNMHSFMNSTAILSSDEFSSVQDDVASNFDIQPAAQTTARGLLGLTGDALSIAGSVLDIGSLFPATAPFAVGADSAFSIAGVVIQGSLNETEAADGTPWAAKERELITASQIGSQIAAEYVDAKTAFDLQIQRILTDANRLALEGSALNQFSWNEVSVDLSLQPYQVAVRRQLYTSLMATSYSVLHYIYSAPDNNIEDAFGYYVDPSIKLCTLSDFTSQVGSLATAFLPGALIDGSSPAGFPTTHHSPHDKWWDVWAVGQNGFHTDCPRTYDFRDTQTALKQSHLLDPMQPFNSSELPHLGLYQSYLFTTARSGLPVIDSSIKNTFYTQPIDFNHYRQPYPANGDNDAH